MPVGRGFGAAAAVLAAVVFVGAGASADDEPTPRCRGEVATIVGTGGDDVLVGTDEPDVIVAGDGDDTVLGGRGSDVLCGGDGTDLLQGGRGNDLIDAGPGDRDRAVGGLGDDEMTGGPGDFDEVAGYLGIDTISGGPGDFDLVHGDYGYDRMDGGRGKGDIASFATAAAARNGAGVWVSLRAGKARGDGHDRLFRFDSIEGSAFRDELIGNKGDNTIHGGPGNDKIRGGGGGADHIDGGQGTDSCRGATGAVSCGREPAPGGATYVQVDHALGGGGGLAVVGGGGRDDVVVAFDEARSSFGVSAAGSIAVGPGCTLIAPSQADCPADPARWLIADLGPGNDALRVEGSLAGAQNVRLAGGPGNDTIRGGPEDDLIEAGRGADRLYGGDGEDGLVGGLPGPTFLYGEGGHDLLAAGGGCAGGALVGGPGRDNASFAETQAHPGLLWISLAHGKAWVDEQRGCNPVKLPKSNEDIEGSFDWDVLIGDRRDNNLLGQPGKDRFYGGGGADIIDARDGVRDFHIQCGSRRGRSRAITDPFDPTPTACAIHRTGDPVKGLNNSG
jgi:Ca2+-binding RTX toxin-like protein